MPSFFSLFLLHLFIYSVLLVLFSHTFIFNGFCAGAGGRGRKIHIHWRKCRCLVEFRRNVAMSRPGLRQSSERAHAVLLGPLERGAAVPTPRVREAFSGEHPSVHRARGWSAMHSPWLQQGGARSFFLCGARGGEEVFDGWVREGCCRGIGPMHSSRRRKAMSGCLVCYVVCLKGEIRY